MASALWRNPRIIYTLLFVFLSGAAAGAITMRIGLKPERHKSGPYYKDGGREFSLQRLKKELDLSPDQAREMATILEDFMMYYQSLQVQMDDVLATGKNRIVRILKDDQKPKFEKMIGDMQARQSR
ncbi:MAG: hypothetical protein WKF37_06575 [Bryobacteraceae bacterium]